MFFKSANGFLFQVAGLIHPVLRTVLLPHAFARKANSPVTVRIGRPMSAERLGRFLSDRDMTEFLRHRTYLLQCKQTSRAHGAVQATRLAPTTVYLPDAQKTVLQRELQALHADQTLLETEGFSVHLAEPRLIPHLLHEIGRLREATFRLAGEGTGKEVDLDIFDAHYLQLFLWDKHNQRIAGGYRLGRTDTILSRYGKKGLYTTSLFTFKPAFWDHVVPGLELGRSFICPAYQKSYAPLMLLWKGIGRYILNFPQYHILFGPVSIDNEYHRLSRQLIVGFLKKHGYVHELGKYVRPRRPFKARCFVRVSDLVVSLLSDSINDVSEIIADIDAHKAGVPVLLRQYLKLGGKMLGFSVDRDFSDVLDGLVLVDLLRIEFRTLQRYLGSEGADGFLRYHGAAASAAG